MKRYINGELLNIDVSQEPTDLIGWEKPIPKESPQTIRNIGRIDQLEAEQADLKKHLIQVLEYLGPSQWPIPRSQLAATHPSWEQRAHALPSEFDEDLRLWEQAIVSVQPIASAIQQIAPTYHENVSKIMKLFARLEEDFDDIPRRLTRCAVLEEELATFEDSLEDDETENLASCVSLVRDVLDYNYAEHLTRTHLELLKKAIGLIRDKGLECSEENYQNLHNEFLQSGLALLPTSLKAIEKYEPTKSNG